MFHKNISEKIRCHINFACLIPIDILLLVPTLIVLDIDRRTYDWVGTHAGLRCLSLHKRRDLLISHLIHQREVQPRKEDWKKKSKLWKKMLTTLFKSFTRQHCFPQICFDDNNNETFYTSDKVLNTTFN